MKLFSKETLRRVAAAIFVVLIAGSMVLIFYPLS
jgi:hypothetical protein